MPIDKSSFQRASEIQGDDSEDSGLLRKMAAEAQEYLETFRWCPGILEKYLALGVGGIVAIFFFELSERVGGTDEVLWVVVGDLPSAYLVVEPRDNPRAALNRYCDLMDEWAFAVQTGKSLAEEFPVSAEPTYDNAVAMRERVAFIRSEVVLTSNP